MLRAAPPLPTAPRITTTPVTKDAVRELKASTAEHRLDALAQERALTHVVDAGADGSCASKNVLLQPGRRDDFPGHSRIEGTPRTKESFELSRLLF